jgi:AcrR family transcriptional regulator
MSTELQEKRSGEVTRLRIFDAALIRFGQASYEEVKLRDIAADVGVDVALVHRSFGSKEQLFAEVLEVAVQSNRLLTSETADLSAVFAKNIFERDADPGSDHMDALQIFIHSLSSPQAREVLRAFVLRDFIRPLAAKLTDLAPQRAALFVACLTGINILRNVLDVAPLRAGDRAEMEPLIERILSVCLDEGLKAAGPTVTGVSTQPRPQNRCTVPGSSSRPKRHVAGSS